MSTGHRMLQRSILPVAICTAFLLGGLGCTSEDDRVRFDNIYFKAKTTAEGEDRRAFMATVFDATQNIEAAREAGRYEGTKYCIAFDGTSRIDWTLGPDDPDESLQIRDNALTFQGRCDP